MPALRRQPFVLGAAVRPGHRLFGFHCEEEKRGRRRSQRGSGGPAGRRAHDGPGGGRCQRSDCHRHAGARGNTPGERQAHRRVRAQYGSDFVTAALRGKAAIAGVGIAHCGEAPGLSEMEILAAASRKAIADAGLKLADIDGLCAASTTTFFPTLAAAEYLGIRPAFSDCNSIGGSSFVSHLIPAVLALEAGLCNAVLVAYGATSAAAQAAPRWANSSRGSTPWSTKPPTTRLTRPPAMRWPPRVTCTSSALAASTLPKSPSPRANGRG